MQFWSRKPQKILREADGRGLKSFSEKVHVYRTEERQQIALELLSSGFNYNVEIIDDEKELIECYEITKYRNTSAERFNLLVGNHTSKVDTV